MPPTYEKAHKKNKEEQYVSIAYQCRQGGTKLPSVFKLQLYIKRAYITQTQKVAVTAMDFPGCTLQWIL